VNWFTNEKILKQVKKIHHEDTLAEAAFFRLGDSSIPWTVPVS
jgi:hypothetical protein